VRPRPVTDADLAFWDGERRVFACPPDLPDCEPCEVSIDVTDGSEVVRVPWVPTADDVAILAAGGTLWLTQWGGLAPHDLSVIPKADPG
jgi:hypothetical protein